LFFLTLVNFVREEKNSFNFHVVSDISWANGLETRYLLVTLIVALINMCYCYINIEPRFMQQQSRL